MDLADILSVSQQILSYELFTISGTPITAMDLVVATLILALSIMVSIWIRRGMARALRRQRLDEGSAAIALRLTHYLVMAVGITFALDNLGVDLGALFAAGAIFAVGIGFAMQNIAQNFVSGLILVVERAIKPRDVLEVEGRVVRVVRMGIRTTVARTRDEEELIIPNATLVQSTVKNYTLQDSHFRIRVLVGVTYGSDMKRVREILTRTAEGVDWRLPTPEPLIFLKEFGNSAVVWEVSVWINDPWASQRLGAELHDTIWWALQEAGITIAFPQLDVHFDPLVEKSIERLPRAG